MALTEKGTQRIEIIVRKAGVGMKGAKETSADNVSNTTDNATDEEKKGAGSIKSDAFKRTQITHSIAVAKQIGQQWLGYYMAGIGYKNGDAVLQAEVERAYEIVNDFGSVASSTVMGVAYGASGGPMGMALGAAMGLAQSASSIALKYSTRKRDYQVKMFKENNAIEYKRARAQINLTTGRLR